MKTYSIKRGEETIASNMLTLGQAAMAFSAYCEQQYEECSLDLVDSDGNVIQSEKIEEKDLLLPHRAAARKTFPKTPKKAKKKTSSRSKQE